jgi:putative ABC transport system permease protein
MNFVALRMLTRDRAKYVGLIFAIAFSTFLLENQSSIFAGIMKRTTHQILDITDADIWVMDKKTLYINAKEGKIMVLLFEFVNTT